VTVGYIVIFASMKSIHDAGRNSQSAKHDRHRRSEVFAMTSLATKKKVRNRVFRRDIRKLQRVCVGRRKVALDLRGLQIWCGLVSGDLLCKIGHSRIQISREL